MIYFGEIYTMVANVGVHDPRTGLNYSQKDLPDLVAKYLLDYVHKYRDRILTIEEYERLGRPTYSYYQIILANGGELPVHEIPEVEYPVFEEIPEIEYPVFEETPFDEGPGPGEEEKEEEEEEEITLDE